MLYLNWNVIMANMLKSLKSKSRKSQTAIEYLLLFTITAIIVFVGFRTLLPRMGEVSNAYFNVASNGIMGQPPPPFTAINFPLLRGGCAWSPSCQEDDWCSGTRKCYEWNGGVQPFMCGRWHDDDENGQTQNWCCSSNPLLSPADVIEITCGDESECGAMECPNDHPFMVGRVHFNDENGRTFYQCAEVVDGDGNPLSMTGPQNTCAWTPSGWTLKESDGVRFTCPTERPFLKGRWHDTGSSCGGDDGDENTCTKYLCCDAISYQ